MSLPLDCCEAILKGRRGIHVVTAKGSLYEATDARWIGTAHMISTRHLNGEPGPELHCQDLTALERTYENPD